MKPELFWITGPWRGRLAIAARPRGGDWLPDEFQALRSDGVDAMVSLLEEPEAAELELPGGTPSCGGELDRVHPVSDSGSPPAPARAKTWRSTAATALAGLD